MEQKLSQAELEQKINTIIAYNEHYSSVEPSLEEQEKYLNTYSSSALVCSAFYFWYMKDRSYFFLSLVAAVLFFPIIFILPFSARRRAWKMGQWRSFNHFQSVQKKWDKASIYVLIISIILIYVLVSYEIKLIMDLFNSNGYSIKNIQELQQNMQDILGN